MPPEYPVAQHGIAIIQSIMQFIGHAQHADLQQGEDLSLMHGFMHGMQHDIGQSAMANAAVCARAARPMQSGLMRASDAGASS